MPTLDQVKKLQIIEAQKGANSPQAIFYKKLILSARPKPKTKNKKNKKTYRTTPFIYFK